MRRTIELDADTERRLNDLAQALQVASPDEALTRIVRDFLLAAETSRTSLSPEALRQVLDSAPDLLPYRSTSDVMGGDVCIRNTRIPVWLLVSLKQEGLGDAQLLANFPMLTIADLTMAWDFYAAHADLIESQRRAHEEAA